MSTGYRFDNTWRLPASRDRVYAALAEVEGYQLWWTQIRRVHRIDEGSVRVWIRSFLPYTLELVLASSVQDEQRGILRVDVEGDLRGWSAWQITGEGTGTRAEFSQDVEVTVPALQRAPLAVRPLLRANHAHMMRSGERALRTHLSNPTPSPNTV